MFLIFINFYQILLCVINLFIFQIIKCDLIHIKYLEIPSCITKYSDKLLI